MATAPAFGGPPRRVIFLLAPLFVACTALLQGADAAEPQRAPAACAPTAFAPAGRYDARSQRRGPGLVLSGAGAAGMPRAAFRWMRARIGAPGTGRGGNVVIVRASGARDSTPLFYEAGGFGWVQEILIPPCATRAQVNAMATIVDRGDAVFFSGGDQANYVGWKGSALIGAVRRLYARGGVVGGGSAGLAIQGAVVYDSVAADRLHPGDDDYNVHTGDALGNPLEPEISFTTGLFAWPPLRATITDTHFVARNRFGRLVAFLARILHDGLGSAPFYGLGVDQGSVVLVDGAGRAIVRVDAPSRGAFVLRMTSVPAIRAHAPLRASVDVMHVAHDGERFDLARKAGAPWRRISVDALRTPPYDAAFARR